MNGTITLSAIAYEDRVTNGLRRARAERSRIFRRLFACTRRPVRSQG